MAAILFSTHFFETRAAFRRLGSEIFSGSSRHEVAAIVEFTRRLLAVAGNSLLALWAAAALGFWSLILFGLLQ
jgi:hypothetical protein